MKRSLLRSYLIENSNTWLTTGDTGLWEYGNYRHCYLVVRRLENGKFKPMIGAVGDIEVPGIPVPPEGYHQFDTLKQAQDFLFKYVDYIREVRDEEEKLALQQRLHRMNPKVFPA